MPGIYYVRNTRIELWARRIGEWLIAWAQRKAFERRTPCVPGSES